VLVDTHACIGYMNPAAEQLLGQSQQRARGRRMHELRPGLGELQALIQRAAHAGRPFGQTLTLELPQQKERASLVVSCRVSPWLPDSKWLVLELLDASPWWALDREQALLAQRRASRRIIRQLAHEVRNPLGGLRGAAQLLERQLTNTVLREYTEVIIAEADRLVALTDSLLGPAHAPRQVPVNLHETTERVLLLMESASPEGVRFARDYDPSLPPLEADPDQLVQALLNLVRNAVQAVGVKGAVCLRTRALTGHVVGGRRHRLVASIEVEDNGPGVPKDIADALFYPLVSGRDRGSGLGLPLAQDLVSRNGGLVEFESEPGRTVFTMRFPLEVAGP
jgi:two-component system nitrogen regulation sensor histidine kinase GlnL